MNDIRLNYNQVIPDKSKLSQNYPNPFNPTTKINYAINVPGHVSLIIYNMLGRKVLTLVNEYQSTGNYEVNFSANNQKYQLPSGMYIYRLQSKNFKQSKKMILMK